MLAKRKIGRKDPDRDCLSPAARTNSKSNETRVGGHTRAEIVKRGLGDEKVAEEGQFAKLELARLLIIQFRFFLKRFQIGL